VKAILKSYENANLSYIRESQIPACENIIRRDEVCQKSNLLRKPS